MGRSKKVVVEEKTSSKRKEGRRCVIESKKLSFVVSGIWRRLSQKFLTGIVLCSIALVVVT